MHWEVACKWAARCFGFVGSRYLHSRRHLKARGNNLPSILLRPPTPACRWRMGRLLEVSTMRVGAQSAVAGQGANSAPLNKGERVDLDSSCRSSRRYSPEFRAQTVWKRRSVACGWCVRAPSPATVGVAQAASTRVVQPDRSVPSSDEQALGMPFRKGGWNARVRMQFRRLLARTSRPAALPNDRLLPRPRVAHDTHAIQVSLAGG